MKSVREHATLCECKTGAILTPDLVSTPTVSPWAGQGRSGEPARTARQRRVFILAQNDRSPYCPERRSDWGAKSVVDKAGRRFAVERTRRVTPYQKSTGAADTLRRIVTRRAKTAGLGSS
jgi:hypothetical protein